MKVDGFIADKRCCVKRYNDPMGVVLRDYVTRWEYVQGDRSSKNKPNREGVVDVKTGERMAVILLMVNSTRPLPSLRIQIVTGPS